ncbi:SusC/RagA family TonB-linked outer membrane protein [Bacteroidia bacterium]|nr:SusC/RagA family TonB-linked outer membrane protein [Bacteroidia bacterium]
MKNQQINALYNFIKHENLRFIQITLLLVCISVGGAMAASPGATTTPPPSETTIQQQSNVTIRGTVSDESGQPIIGANVVVSGTTVGVITDLDGKFELSVSANATVKVSYVGYLPQDFKVVAGKNQYPIVLREDSEALEEVVVIGYGVVKKSDVTGSVVSVNAEEMMKRNPTTIGQGLQGAAAGVYVGNNGGPSGETSIRIRGAATINNSTDPLFVVDGIRVGTNVNFLNPADVESIEILKDASATAIYGSQGANGVVMITTKKGEQGRAKVNVQANFGVQMVTNTLDVLDAPGYAKAAQRAALANNTSVNTAWLNYADQLNTIDWQKEMAQNALRQNYNMSVSGGNENTRAVMSVGYFNNEGVIINTNFRRVTARANIDQTIKKFLRTGINVTYMYNESYGGFGSLLNYAVTPPTMDDVDSNGNLVHIPVQSADGTWGHFFHTGTDVNKTQDNPVAASVEGRKAGNNNWGNMVLTNAYVDFDIVKGLVFRTIGSINYNTNSSSTYNPVNQRTQMNMNDTSDNYSVRMYSGTTLSLESYLTYNLNIKNIHSIGAMAGYSISRDRPMEAYGYSKFLPVATIRRVELSTQPSTYNTSGGLGLETRQESFFGRINYSYQSKYLLTATVRRDGSSNFGAGNRYGVFPSAALSWRASEEEFIKNLGIFSNLKVRLGWGQTGNAGRPTNQSRDQLSSDHLAYYWYNGSAFTTAPGLAQIREIDTNLKWETNEQTNIGLDFGFANNTYTFSLDYFIRDAKDLLLERSIRPSTGYTNIYTNAGHIRNTGLEAMAVYQKQVGKDWFFNIRLNGSTLKNEVISIGEPIFREIGTGDWWTQASYTQEGAPIASFNGWRVDHVFQNQAEIDALNAKSPDGIYQYAATRPGDYMYKDLNGDNKITDEDREVFGDGFPTLNYGLNVGINYKNWDLNLYMYGVGGQEVMSFAYKRLSTMRNGTEGYSNILKEAAANAWTPENPSNKYSRLTRADDNHNGQVSDAYLKKADFLKIQNLQIGYNLPASTVKKLLVDNVRVYASCENILTITNYVAGLDPEITAINPNDRGNRNGNVLWTGFDTGHYPLPRAFSLGISIGF